MRQTYLVKGMHCSSCVMNIEEALLELDAVTDVEASLRSGKVAIDSTEQVPDTVIGEVIREAGYELVGVA